MDKRDANLDLIRCVATLMVVSVHFFLNTTFYDLPIDNWQMIVMVFLRVLFIPCVPLFLILSGYLMKNKKLSYRYYTQLAKVLVIYIQASVVIYLFRVFIFHEKLSIWEGIMGIFDYSTAPYAWYIEMYLALYLLIPFLNKMWNSCRSVDEHRLLLFVLISITILPTFFNTFEKIIPDFFQQMYPITYYFSGVYIATYKKEVKQKPVLLSGLVALFVSGIHNVLVSYGGVFKWEGFNDYYSYQAYFLAIFIFIGLLKVKISNRWKQPLALISNYTLYMYLLSYVLDTLVYPRFKAVVPSMKVALYWIILPIFLVYTGSFVLAVGTKMSFSILPKRRKARK